MIRCEGWHRYGGIFTLGPVKWVQCENDASVILEVEQDGKIQKMPACNICLEEATQNKIKILTVSPIEETNNG